MRTTWDLVTGSTDGWELEQRLARHPVRTGAATLIVVIAVLTPFRWLPEAAPLAACLGMMLCWLAGGAIGPGMATSITLLAGTYYAKAIDPDSRYAVLIIPIWAAASYLSALATSRRRGYETTIRDTALADQRAVLAAERAEQRTRHLWHLTESLRGAVTTTQVARILLDHAAEALNARAGSVGLLDDTAPQLLLVARLGEPADIDGSLAGAPTLAADADLPGPASVRDGRARWFANADELAAAHPHAADTHRWSGLQALVCLPVIAGSRAAGYLQLSFDEQREFSDEDRSLLKHITSQCSQALERAQLHEW